MLFTIKAALDRVLQAALIVCFSTLSLCVLWQVISRYLLNDPSTFTEEYSRFAVIWLSLLGTAYACGRIEHMAYTMLEEKLTGAALHAHMRAVAVIVLAFALAVLIYGGGKLVLRAFEVEQLSATLEVPMGYVYLCIPIAGVAAAFYQIVIIVAPGHARPADEVEQAIEHVEKELQS
ncbi:TRAP transporter small permease [Uliginosibacterium sp. sgz301328]|uniref:TRAP transporter small permease n=1 Tax=Uliginosibacterium sp. sgz301328 TaxID=3243764 RepID=UPI00359EE2CC